MEKGAALQTTLDGIRWHVPTRLSNSALLGCSPGGQFLRQLSLSASKALGKCVLRALATPEPQTPRQFVAWTKKFVSAVSGEDGIEVMSDMGEWVTLKVAGSSPSILCFFEMRLESDLVAHLSWWLDGFSQDPMCV